MMVVSPCTRNLNDQVEEICASGNVRTAEDLMEDIDWSNPTLICVRAGLRLYDFLIADGVAKREVFDGSLADALVVAYHWLYHRSLGRIIQSEWEDRAEHSMDVIHRAATRKRKLLAEGRIPSPSGLR